MKTAVRALAALLLAVAALSGCDMGPTFKERCEAAGERA